MALKAEVARVTADVRTADVMDRLVVTPRQRDAVRSLSRAVRESLPGVKVRQSADGVWLASTDAEALLSVGGAIDLRWSADARIFAENRRRARSVHGRLREALRDLIARGRAAADTHVPLRDGYEVLDDHQRVNVAAMTLPGGYGLCLFDEQGAGKTVCLIFAFDLLVERDEADFLLIVAPKSMLSEWERDFHRFRDDLYRVRVASGGRRAKRSALASGADVLVTNFETAAAMERELQALLRRHGHRAVLAVDESFYVKNLDAQRTRSIRRLRELCGRAFVLCGTPAPNTPHDLVQQFNIVDFGVTFDGVGVPLDQAAAPAVVQRALDERGLFVRHLKVDVLPGLPGKRFSKVLLPLQPRQEAIYRSALQGLVADLRSSDDETFQRHLTSYLARRNALLQVCSHPAAIVEGYDEVPAKQVALDALLDELVTRRREKVVLWSFYTTSLGALFARYGRFNPVRYDGSVTDVTVRREAVRRFQEDEATRLFIGNPAAAGAGLTLHRARYAVYESMSNQAAHYLQSLDRIHRRGQDREVEYVVLLCDGTLEVQEYDRLTAKERASQQLLRDRAPEPVSREAMLAELLRDPHLGAKQ